MSDLAERASAIAQSARTRVVSERERNRLAYPEFYAWLEQWQGMGELVRVDFYDTGKEWTR